MPTPVETPDPKQERLGPYVLLEPLGEGGMARVFLARRDGDTRVCVLKRLHVQLEAHPIALKRFQREAHIASMLDHPAIAHVVDAGLEDQRFFIAVEYIPGQTLEMIGHVASAHYGEVPRAFTLAIALDVLEGLAYAHDLTDPEGGRRLNIVHRDLTPRNVMVGYSGRVSIIDFGIARGDVDELKTAPGVLMGTPFYMSPEQARGLPVDARSDVYSFAAVLWELFAGRRLITAKARADVLAQVATEVAPLVSSARATVPKALDPVLAKALAKSPEERYPTARAFREALFEASKKMTVATTADLVRTMRELFPSGEENAARRAAMGGPAASPEVRPGSITRTEARSTLTSTDGAPTVAVARSEINSNALAETKIATSPSLTPAPKVKVTVVNRRSIPVPRVALAVGIALLFGASVAILATRTNVELDKKGPQTRRNPPAEIAPDDGPIAERVVEPPPVGPRAAAVSRAIAETEPPAPPVPELEPLVEPAKAVEKVRAEKTRPIPTAATKPPPKSPSPPNAGHENVAPPVDKAPADSAAAVRIRALRAMLAKLSQTPNDADLRTRLHDAIDAEGERLPQKRRSRVTASNDEAIRSVELGGFERALKQLEQAAADGELP